VAGSDSPCSVLDAESVVFVKSTFSCILTPVKLLRETVLVHIGTFFQPGMKVVRKHLR